MFEKLKKNIDKSLVTVSVKSATYLESEKLKAKISNIQEENAAQLQTMGNQLYNAWKETAAFDTNYMVEVCQKVLENENEIAVYQAKIEELAAVSVARVVDEVAYVVLNGNYALQAGFSVGKDALAYEKSDSEAAKTYVNVVVVKEGNENNEGVKALVDVLKSDEIKNFINEKYDGAVIPFEE